MLNQTKLNRGLGALFTAAISVRIALPLSEIIVAISISRVATNNQPMEEESTPNGIDS